MACWFILWSNVVRTVQIIALKRDGDELTDPQSRGSLATMLPSEFRTIRCPRRQRSVDVAQLTIMLAAELFVAGDLADDLVFAERLAAEELNKGSTLQSFEMMMHAQGGDLMQPRVPAPVRDICAREAGTVVWVDT